MMDSAIKVTYNMKKNLLRHVVAAMVDTFVTGGGLALRGFGQFSMHWRKNRQIALIVFWHIGDYSAGKLSCEIMKKIGCAIKRKRVVE